METTVVQVAPARAPQVLPTSVRLVVLPAPAGGGPVFFAKAHRAVARALPPADLYLASDLYTLPALAAAAQRHDAALVYDARELYAALDSSAGRPWVGASWRAVERRYAPRADAILTVGDAIADRLASDLGIERPHVLYNAPDAPAGAPDRGALRRQLEIPDDGRPIVLYQGLFREGRGLEALVEAVQRVDDWRLVLIGEGALDGWLRAATGDRITVSPFVPPDSLATLTPGADLGACLIEPLTESLRLSLPNKLFEYLAAGVPVLASPLPEIRAVVDLGVGILADPSDPVAVARALRDAAPSERRESWRVKTASVLDRYAWNRGRPAFQDLIDRLLTS